MTDRNGFKQGENSPAEVWNKGREYCLDFMVKQKAEIRHLTQCCLDRDQTIREAEARVMDLEAEIGRLQTLANVAANALVNS